MSGGGYLWEGGEEERMVRGEEEERVVGEEAEREMTWPHLDN